MGRWALAVIWALVIWLFSSWASLPSLGPTLLDLVLKKSAHFIEFGILAVLLARAIYPAYSDRRWLAVAIALLLTAAWAAIDELHQASTPGRRPSIGDVVVDIVGAVVFLTGWYRLNIDFSKKLLLSHDKLSNPD